VLNASDRGSYVLVLQNSSNKKIPVGKLGNIFFKKGYYVYVGSALHALEKRVQRHFRKKKKKFWHIDYITPDFMDIVKTYLIRRSDQIESLIVKKLRALCTSSIPGFGASDSKEPSHLLYFSSSPCRSRSFIDTILDFRTFSE